MHGDVIGPFALKVGLARAVGAVSRRTGRGGGTTLPGRVLVRLEPRAIERLAARLPDGIAIVSATNGKTTTAAMAAAILGPDVPLCRNTGGANLVSGVASTLLAAPEGARMGLLEVDEFALPDVVTRTSPRALLLGNLFRDQLDRYGELELVAERWRALVARLDASTRLVVGADDPAVGDLGDARDGRLAYGIDDPAVARDAVEDAADTTFCVRCGAAYTYDAVYLAHLGDYRCPRCGHARPTLDLAARDVRLDGVDGSAFRLDAPDGSCEVRLGVPGLYNVENALGALSLAYALGVPTATGAERLAGFRAAFGRFERLRAGDRDVVLLLIKNPAGANEALRTVRDAIRESPLVLALNDRIADGRDVSWIWDVDFEEALPAAAHVVATGTRAADLALRVRYAGTEHDRIELLEDVERALDRGLELAGPGGTAFVLPTYTAMLELQRLVSARGLARPYWEARA